MNSAMQVLYAFALQMDYQ